MASTVVPFKVTSTTDTMNTTTTNTLSVYIAKTSVVNSVSFFGKFQDLTIRTIVSPDISAEPYRKAMISILFFRRILSLYSPPSVTISDLTTTMAAYFAMPTGSAEREAERIMESVCHAFFVVGNLQGIRFLDSSGKPIADSDPRAADIMFFSF